MDLVVDRYLPLSIKSSERERRAAAGMLSVKINNPINDCRTGKSFLPFPTTKQR